MEGLLEAAAGRPISAPPPKAQHPQQAPHAPHAPAPPAAPGLGIAPSGAGPTGTGAPAGAPAVGGASRADSRAEPAAWTPQSAEFGRFIRRLGPEAAAPERQVVAFAFYLWNYERKETFTRRDVEGCFKALHLGLPENLSSLFEDLTDRKRFLERNGEETWRLSKKGEAYVKTRLLTS